MWTVHLGGHALYARGSGQSSQTSDVETITVHWLPCQPSVVMGSVLGQVIPVSGCRYGVCVGQVTPLSECRYGVSVRI